MKMVQLERSNGNISLFLIIYDIVDNKKRSKVAKILEGFGARVQYSAFECRLTTQQFKRMKKQLYDCTSNEDNLRIYELSNNYQPDKETAVFYDLYLI